MTALWITIIFIGVATYAMRVLPLLWMKSNRQEKTQSSWIERLGPCLLSAMAVAIIMPVLQEAESLPKALTVTGGLIASGCSMLLRRDPGMATLVGMITFGILSVAVT